MSVSLSSLPTDIFPDPLTTDIIIDQRHNVRFSLDTSTSFFYFHRYAKSVEGHEIRLEGAYNCRKY
jgi:hypothetical protein